MAGEAKRPGWLLPDFIVLTEAGDRGRGLPIYVHAKAVMAVEDLGNETPGSLVHVPTRPTPFEVTETPHQVFHRIAVATA